VCVNIINTEYKVNNVHSNQESGKGIVEHAEQERLSIIVWVQLEKAFDGTLVLSGFERTVSFISPASKAGFDFADDLHRVHAVDERLGGVAKILARKQIPSRLDTSPGRFLRF